MREIQNWRETNRERVRFRKREREIERELGERQRDTKLQSDTEKENKSKNMYTRTDKKMVTERQVDRKIDCFTQTQTPA